MVFDGRNELERFLLPCHDVYTVIGPSIHVYEGSTCNVEDRLEDSEIAQQKSCTLRRITCSHSTYEINERVVIITVSLDSRLYVRDGSWPPGSSACGWF